MTHQTGQDKHTFVHIYLLSIKTEEKKVIVVQSPNFCHKLECIPQ